LTDNVLNLREIFMWTDWNICL